MVNWTVRLISCTYFFSNVVQPLSDLFILTAAGLGSYVEALVRKPDTEFNVSKLSNFNVSYLSTPMIKLCEQVKKNYLF